MNVGVLGAGQLGRMLALAGYPLGLRFRFFDAVDEAPAQHVGAFQRGDFTDSDALDRFAAGLHVVTLEWENVPVRAAEHLARHGAVHPAPAALATAQDRAAEKELFTRLGIPTPPYRAVSTPAELDQAITAVGLPAVLKTRRHGYDGKGQFVLNEAAAADAAWRALRGQPALLERLVRFDRELSILAVRSRSGAEALYPLVENEHAGGILRVSRAPAMASAALQARAESYARRLVEALDYVGVLCLELFQCGDELLANEIAPRVHNSGHWTIEGAQVSQFENHLRAILDWPLGPTAPRGAAVMLNLIGELPDPVRLIAVPGLRLHLYDKAPRTGRKLGHVTFVGESRAEADDWLGRLFASFPGLNPAEPAGATG